LTESRALAQAINPYDQIRYLTTAHPDTLPSNFAVLAHLRGLPYCPFRQSRVLEVGCGDGLNLLSLAAIAPEAEFVGIDLAPVPVADGQALARAAGLSNVSLKVGDIFDPDVVEGTFDYIIAHGVYAWVPPPVQEALVRLCGRALGREGLGFISYNVLPGCDIRRTIRTVLQNGVAGLPTREAKAGAVHEILDFFAAAWEQQGPMGKALALEARAARQRSPAQLFHDELGEFYEPALLSDVVARLYRHGLDYVADAQPRLNATAFFPELALDSLRHRADGDWVRYEQLQDFITHRLFRESLVRRSDGFPVPHRVDWTRLRPLFAEAKLQAEAPAEAGHFAFRGDDGQTLETDNAELAHLIERICAEHPAKLSLSDEIPDAGIGTALLRLYVGGMIRLSTDPEVFAITAGERPCASPLARAQVARGDELLVALRHMMVDSIDAGGRHLVTLLDGTRTRGDLIAAMSAHLNAPPAELEQRLPETLAALARSSLLVRRQEVPGPPQLRRRFC
jgi:SAM-dependent methyltransferase